MLNCHRMEFPIAVNKYHVLSYHNIYSALVRSVRNTAHSTYITVCLNNTSKHIRAFVKARQLKWNSDTGQSVRQSAIQTHNNLWRQKTARCSKLHGPSQNTTLTHAIEQSPSWEADSASGSPEIRNILWPVQWPPLLRQIHPFHSFTLHSFKILFNIIFPSTYRFSRLHVIC